MSRSDFDDWNLSTPVLTEPEKTPKVINTRLNSTLFLLSFAALLLFGIVCVYSATYPKIFDYNIGGFEFVIRQLIYMAIGISIGGVLLILPDQIIKVLSYLLMLICMIVLAVNIIALNKNVVSEISMQLIILTVTLFFASFFAKKGNLISRLRDLIIPVVIVVTMIFLILYEKNITFAVLLFIISIVMFACGGVGFGGVLLLLLFGLVPVVCIVFSKPDAVTSLLRFFVPGFAKANEQINQTFVRLQAISSGGFFGKGIGLGQFKYGNIAYIESSFIFCNICEESGFAGCFLLFALMLIYVVTGFRAAIHLRRKNAFASNLVTGLVSHCILCFCVNILGCLGILPVSCVSLPFVSFGAAVIPFTIEAFIIFKYAREKGE